MGAGGIPVVYCFGFVDFKTGCSKIKTILFMVLFAFGGNINGFITKVGFGCIGSSGVNFGCFFGC